MLVCDVNVRWGDEQENGQLSHTKEFVTEPPYETPAPRVSNDPLMSAPPAKDGGEGGDEGGDEWGGTGSGGIGPSSEGGYEDVEVSRPHPPDMPFMKMYICLNVWRCECRGTVV